MACLFLTRCRNAVPDAPLDAEKARSEVRGAYNSRSYGLTHGRFARNTLVAEFLIQEWADLFRGKTRDELDAIAASFKFENCAQRKQLNETLQKSRIQ